MTFAILFWGGSLLLGIWWAMHILKPLKKAEEIDAKEFDPLTAQKIYEELCKIPMLTPLYLESGVDEVLAYFLPKTSLWKPSATSTNMTSRESPEVQLFNKRNGWRQIGNEMVFYVNGKAQVRHPAEVRKQFGLSASNLRPPDPGVPVGPSVPRSKVLKKIHSQLGIPSECAHHWSVDGDKLLYCTICKYKPRSIREQAVSYAQKVNKRATKSA
jgi:hypothetical protein